ncbi:AMP-dependent synthetase [Trebonia kvetii]|uniref:AMP-dependent synthetase n=1 Tax=Trebonia kvetii TaxID=2480626 RepID=A0A6P2C5W8_9ACTN|nr:AMP-binding protein [Trebonia kvetii]TVZ06397.1 AMP-dependent synthetase [Trebonia kvetii]
MTVGSAGSLRRLVTRSDGHPALVVPESGAVLSYAGLQRALDRAAGRLAAIGVREGDRVALAAANGPALIVAFLAVVASDAVAAPLNPTLGEAELTAELGDLRVSRLLHDGVASAVAAADRSDVPASVIGMAEGLLHIDGEAGSALETAGSPDALGLLLHTSGTTSKPKTVPIRQRNLVASTAAVADTYALSGDDVTACVMPLFHVHGLVATVLATLSTGGTVLLPRFRPSTFWDDAARHGVTWYTAVPTIHARLLTGTEVGGPLEHRIRFVRSCSAPLPTALWRRYEETIGVPLVEAYGMTEAAHQMASNPLPPRERRPGTVGLGTGTEVVALDDDWRPVPPGDEGEIAVRGPSVVDEYLDNPAATFAAFRNGWFRTGDVGRLSADGYLSLVGRVKELINRAGEKISPYEVEDVLLTHPSVAEAAAYPVPDEKYGEQVGVVIVLRGDATPRELTLYCAERLAAFKRPVRVTILDSIPKGPTGKIQRRNLAGLVGGGS